jgi:hypothetical protein
MPGLDELMAMIKVSDKEARIKVRDQLRLYAEQRWKRHHDRGRRRHPLT